jgi:predicted MFS family arabinose efflux permease
VTVTFSEGAERTKALGIWSAIAAGGGAFGLLLGGILTEALSWEWIFFVNVPVGLAAGLLTLRHVPESRADMRPASADVGGAVSVTAGLMVLVYAIVKAEDWGFASASTLGLVGLSVALLAAFVFIESHSKAPLIRLGIFRVRSLSSANAVMLLVAGGMFAFFFLSTLYVQLILGYDALQAGLAFLPVTAGIMTGAGLAQQLIRRLGVRLVAIVGMVVAAAGLFLMSGVSPDGSYVGDILPGLILMSTGMGLTFVPLTLIATTNVDPDDAGLASGLFNTSQQVGGALGLAILSVIAADRSASVLADAGTTGAAAQASALVEGYQVAFQLAGGLLLVSAIAMALLLRPHHVANVTPDEAPAMAGA